MASKRNQKRLKSDCTAIKVRLHCNVWMNAQNAGLLTVLALTTTKKSFLCSKCWALRTLTCLLLLAGFGGFAALLARGLLLSSESRRIYPLIQQLEIMLCLDVARCRTVHRSRFSKTPLKLLKQSLSPVCKANLIVLGFAVALFLNRALYGCPIQLCSWQVKPNFLPNQCINW